MLLAGFFFIAILVYGVVPVVVEKKMSVSLPNKKLKFSVIAAIIAITWMALNFFLLEQCQFKFVSEYIGYVKAAGAIGAVGFMLQHLYYFAEAMLCCFMLRLFQQGGEKIFKIQNIPYGGIALGILWGLIIHSVSKDLSVGLFALLLSLVWGIIYLVSDRNRWLTYLLMSIMFIC